ncbi:MAG: 3-dehydroquinate synthase [Nitrospiraceae bacterium]|nr:3-dehydroquinate synthase [Nitrospira sp.]MCB9773372.1 3-dehydroquinate synthase [Nitrospiraceae bacterium]
MKTSESSNHVPVSLGDRSYQVLIQPHILPQIGRVLQDVGLAGRVAIVTNPVVNEIYGRVVFRSLKRCGFSPFLVVIPDGEKAKSMYWLSKILDELVTQRLERQEVVLALGGGVVGDVAGFAASVYLRGVSFVQVPTTLVAQVDSSVGGKTGVNHPIGKNLIGAFYQPRVVVVDPQALQSLPKREWVAGLAEVIKYGMIADLKFFEYLEQHVEDLREQAEDVIPTVIRRCCEIKAEVVGGDERESGRRRILNYGHTVGHALETWGRYRTWIHGEAVGIGMVQEATMAHFLGLCTKELVERQRDLIQDVGLPIVMPSMTFMELWGAIQHDKKVVNGQINCVLPTTIGKVKVVPLVRQRIRQWFTASQSSRGKGLDLLPQAVSRPHLSKKK